MLKRPLAVCALWQARQRLLKIGATCFENETNLPIDASASSDPLTAAVASADTAFRAATALSTSAFAAATTVSACFEASCALGRFALAVATACSAALAAADMSAAAFWA